MLYWKVTFSFSERLLTYWEISLLRSNGKRNSTISDFPSPSSKALYQAAGHPAKQVAKEMRSSLIAEGPEYVTGLELALYRPVRTNLIGKHYRKSKTDLDLVLPRHSFFDMSKAV